ncbi:hypothetical protein THAOC_16752 [Thalassiosira oceanica]|uniref:Helicase-associated domain-containing protein n=1 Tax=Thalassiosira oceanica TaxID=159749 RepID=K0SWL4_THAOC|nr:hypothetical protein THAOC_16752 [Thalassiosira oceanica]|eukprot:EJK62627.1 hypothetical protein THAOC_16752 [Thalassiosira oceanica]
MHNACHAIPRQNLEREAAASDFILEDDHERYTELAAYKKKYGHFVIFGDQGPPGLRQWVATQRYEYKHGRLSEKRTRILEGIGLDLSSVGFSKVNTRASPRPQWEKLPSA